MIYTFFILGDILFSGGYKAFVLGDMQLSSGSYKGHVLVDIKFCWWNFHLQYIMYSKIYMCLPGNHISENINYISNGASYYTRNLTTGILRVPFFKIWFEFRADFVNPEILKELYLYNYKFAEYSVTHTSLRFNDPIKITFLCTYKIIIS